MKRVNVAMIGHRFMGGAHSDARRQVSHVFETPSEPVIVDCRGRRLPARAQPALSDTLVAYALPE